MTAAWWISMAWTVLPAAGEPAAMTHFNVTAYGARPDGRSLSTAGIQKAIDAAAEAGGGLVLIPPGRFISGSLTLRSHVELHVQAGAVLEGSRELRDYEVGGKRRGLIFAADARHVTLSGSGIIRGNAGAFATDQTKPLENTSGRHARRGDALRIGTVDGPVAMNRRPGNLIRFVDCHHVEIRDLTLEDAPEWTVTLSECDGAAVRGIRILNNPLIPNNDGIHCVSSRNVRISDCDVRAGDDAIAITGLWGRPGAAAENITVSNCTLQSRSSGVRVGYGSNSIRRCTFQNLVIHDSNRGLGVFVRDEGSVSDVLFANIIIQTRLHTGDWWGRGEPIHVSCLPQKADRKLGNIENVRFRDIQATGEHGIVVWGQPDRMIRGLSFQGIQLRLVPGPLNDALGGNFDLRPAFPDERTLFAHDIPGLYARCVEGLRISDFTLEWRGEFPPFFTHGIECEQFSGLDVDGFEGRQASVGSGHAAMALREGTGFSIRNCRAAPGTEVFLVQDSVSGPRLLTGNDLTCARDMVLPDTRGILLQANRSASGPSD